MSRHCYIDERRGLLILFVVKFYADDEFELILFDLKRIRNARFDREHRAWHILARDARDVANWAQAHFLVEEIHWTIDGIGPGDRRTHQQYAGRRQPRGAPLGSVAAAYAHLHLLPSAPDPLVDAAHRVLARLSHPDAGGSHDAMVAINTAYDTIRKARS